MEKIHESYFADYFIKNIEKPYNFTNFTLIKKYSFEQKEWKCESGKTNKESEGKFNIFSIYEYENNFYLLCSNKNDIDYELYYMLEINSNIDWMSKFFKEKLNESSSDEKQFKNDILIIGKKLQTIIQGTL